MINDDVLGEYIYISKVIYPNVVIFYQDKKVIKSTEVKDVNSEIVKILHQLKCEDSEYGKYIINNIETILEVILNKNGVLKFSISIGVNNE